MVHNDDDMDTNTCPTETYFAGAWIREFLLSNFDFVGKTFKMKNMCVCIEEIPDMTQCPDGSVVYRATDTDLSMRIIFTPNSIINANDSQDSNISVCSGPVLLGSTVLLEKCRLTHLTLPGTEYGDFAFEVHNFSCERNKSIHQELESTKSSQFLWCSEDPRLQDVLKFVFNKRGKGTLSVHAVTNSLDSLLEDLSWNQTTKYTLYIPPEIEAIYCLDHPEMFGCGKKIQLNESTSIKNKTVEKGSDKRENRISTCEFESARSSSRSPEKSSRSPEKSSRSPEKSSRSPEKSSRSPEKSVSKFAVVSNIRNKNKEHDVPSDKGKIDSHVNFIINQVALGLFPEVTKTGCETNDMQPLISLKRLLPSEMSTLVNNETTSETEAQNNSAESKLNFLKWIPKTQKARKRIKSPTIFKNVPKPDGQDTTPTSARMAKTKAPENVANDSVFQAAPFKTLKSPITSKISSNSSNHGMLLTTTQPSVSVADNAVLQAKSPKSLLSPITSKISPRPCNQNMSPKAKSSGNIAYDSVLQTLLTSSQIGLPLSDSLQVLSSQDQVSEAFAIYPQIEPPNCVEKEPTISSNKNFAIGYHDAFSNWLASSQKETVPAFDSPDKNSTSYECDLQRTLHIIASSPGPRVVLKRLPSALNLEMSNRINSLNDKTGLSSNNKPKKFTSPRKRHSSDIEIVFESEELTLDKSLNNESSQKKKIQESSNMWKCTPRKQQTNKLEAKLVHYKNRNSAQNNTTTIKEMQCADAQSTRGSVKLLESSQARSQSPSCRTSRRNAPLKRKLDNSTNTSQIYPSTSEKSNKKLEKGNDESVNQFYATVMDKNKGARKRGAAVQENEQCKRQINNPRPQGNTGQHTDNPQTLVPSTEVSSNPKIHALVLEEALLQRVLDKIKSICSS